MLEDFKKFIMRGNVVDLAVGIVIGVAFGAIITSFVKDVLMPPIGLALGNVDFANLFAVLREGTVPGPYPSLAAAQEAGAVSINYGIFINTIISFLIIAAVIFFFVVRPIGKLYARQKAAEAELPPSTKECPYCYTNIAIKATRCPNCTSELKSS
ncbi:MAG: large conductance mechanosensitive channel protein MscL [Dehalococcoidia bacterium]|jgi:large conductance mechanosensitive channel